MIRTDQTARQLTHYKKTPPRLRMVNTVPLTVEWEEWHCDLGEKSVCEDALSPKEASQ